MSIIRKRDDQGRGPNQKNASFNGSEPSFPKLNLNPGPKDSVVSNIVNQLIASGYSGDLMSDRTKEQTALNPNNRETIHPDMLVDDPVENGMITDDIVFEEKDNSGSQEEKVSQSKTKKEERIRKANLYEEKAKKSQQQIEEVSNKAKVLYNQVDEFISVLHKAANNTENNLRLNRKLENLRRICVGFVRTIDQQMPTYATSLFVDVEDDNG
jgi:hypothetical protein